MSPPADRLPPLLSDLIAMLASAVPAPTRITSPIDRDAVANASCQLGTGPQARLDLQGEAPMPYNVPQLMRMSQAELDALFTASEAGDIPEGEGKGTAIIAPGTVFTAELASIINLFAWQGKIFDSAHGVLRNRILPFGLSAIIAKIYRGDSWLDGKSCIVLDYSETSLVAHWNRDEIRAIQPGMYLGKAYWDKARLLDFVLEF